MLDLGIWAKLSPEQRAEHGPRIGAYAPNNETKDDPNWVDPEDGSLAPQVNKYINGEWIDQLVIRYLKTCSRKGQVVLNAQDNVVTNPIE